MLPLRSCGGYCTLNKILLLLKFVVLGNKEKRSGLRCCARVQRLMWVPSVKAHRKTIPFARLPKDGVASSFPAVLSSRETIDSYALCEQWLVARDRDIEEVQPFTNTRYFFFYCPKPSLSCVFLSKKWLARHTNDCQPPASLRAVAHRCHRIEEVRTKHTCL